MHATQCTINFDIGPPCIQHSLFDSTSLQLIVCCNCVGPHADWANPQGDGCDHISILPGKDRLQVQRAGDGDAMAQQLWLWAQDQEVQNEVRHVQGNLYVQHSPWSRHQHVFSWRCAPAGHMAMMCLG